MRDGSWYSPPGFLQGLNVLVHHTGRDVLYLHIPDDGVDVVDNGIILFPFDNRSHIKLILID